MTLEYSTDAPISYEEFAEVIRSNTPSPMDPGGELCSRDEARIRQLYDTPGLPEYVMFAQYIQKKWETRQPHQAGDIIEESEAGHKRIRDRFGELSIPRQEN